MFQGTVSIARLIITSTTSRAGGRWLVAVTCAGALLRFPFLFERMCHDEAETFVMFASRSLWTCVSHYPFPNNQILHTLFVHSSTKAFGSAPWAIRTPAFVAGVLLIPATYFAVRRLFDERPAMLAAALAAVSWPLVSYSANARGYTMIGLIFMLMVVVAARLKSGNDPASWAAFVLLGSCGFFVSPTMLYYFGGLVIWLLVSALRRDSPALPSKLIFGLVVSCLAVACVVLLLYTPALLHSGVTEQVSSPSTYTLPWDFTAARLTVRMAGAIGYLTFSVMFSMSRSGPMLVLMVAVTAAVTVLLLYGFVLAGVSNRRLGRHRSNLALVTMAWSAALVCMQGYFPPERVFVPFLPLYLGYASAGLCFAWSRFRSRCRAPERPFFLRPAPVAAALVVLALVVLLAQLPWQPRDMTTMSDARRMAGELKEVLRPGDVVYMEPVVRKSLEYYFIRDGLSLSCLYGTPEQKTRLEQGGEGETAGGRCFVIAAPHDGAPIEKTLKWAGLPSREEIQLVTVVAPGRSGAYRIEVPEEPAGEARAETGARSPNGCKRQALSAVSR